MGLERERREEEEVRTREPINRRAVAVARRAGGQRWQLVVA